MLFIYFSAVLHLLSWKHERWATPKLELSHTWWGQAKTSERPGRKRTQHHLQALSPSKYMPFCWGQDSSRAKKILFCSTSFLAPEPNSSMEILAGNTSVQSVWTVAWDIQPEAAQLLLLEEAPSDPLAPTRPLRFHRSLADTVKPVAISRRLLPSHKHYYYLV